MEIKINGEYWIQAGYVNFADGDVGDANHENIAIQHVFYQYAQEIESLAQEYNIEVENSYGDSDPEHLMQALNNIHEFLTGQKNINDKQAWLMIMKELGCNKEAFDVLLGNGDARLYAMKYENWIAVRSNNVELYGYNAQKQKEIVHGIGEILDQEGHEENDDEEVDLSIYDHKSNKSWNTTLKDLENFSLRPQQMPQTIYNKPLAIANKDQGENIEQKNKSQVNPWKEKGFDWRGTSENQLSFFKMWQILKENSK